MPAAAIFALIGSAPRTSWLPETVMRDAHGFVLTGTALGFDARTSGDSPFGTSLGDLRRGRRARGLDQARGIGGRRRLGRHPLRSRVPRRAAISCVVVNAAPADVSNQRGATCGRVRVGPVDTPSTAPTAGWEDGPM